MTSRHATEHEEEITAAGREYRCLFRRETGGGYRVTSPELPPMLAFGASLDAARLNTREEIEAWIDAQDRARGRDELRWR